MILERWAELVRREMLVAAELSQPILIDTLPAILKNLAQRLSLRTEQMGEVFDSTLAQEHGGERARLTHYDQSNLIKEFRLLRKVIVNVLHEKHSPLDHPCLQIIHSFIDDAIQSSATAFSLIQASLREHVVATLTHDMRSPLTAATLGAEMIMKKTNDPNIQAHAQRIKLAHRRIDAMIHDLLNTTLLRSGGKLALKLEPCKSSELLHELSEELPLEQAERLRLTPGTVEGNWDRGHLKRALENLITNAFKYGSHGSRVTVSVEHFAERTMFRVHNLGPPIPKEEQEAIFQIFRRAELARKGKKPGWGLGLPIVRAVAEAHGGSLSLESSQGGGTTFTIDIPNDSAPFQGSAVMSN